MLEKAENPCHSSRTDIICFHFSNSLIIHDKNSKEINI